jgi:hypothetical protein
MRDWRCGSSGKCKALSSNSSPNKGREEGRKKERGRKGASQVVVAYLVILATQEAETRRIAVQSQPGQIVYEPLSRKNPP